MDIYLRLVQIHLFVYPTIASMGESYIEIHNYMYFAFVTFLMV